MFNIKKHSYVSSTAEAPDEESAFLLKEMMIFDISPSHDHSFRVKIGEESVDAGSLSECNDHICSGIKEIKIHLWNKWEELTKLCDVIIENNAGNNGNLDNLLFLNAVKRTYALSTRFSELEKFSESIRSVMDIDISDVHEKMINQFNSVSLEIKLLHHLVMTETYRTMLIKRYSRLTKSAQISGPWANLDLPMKERVWEWAEDEEFFDDRTKARQEQTRYNPEYNKQGFYYVWQDLTRDPYRFEDRKIDSPYKSRHQISIP